MFPLIFTFLNRCKQSHSTNDNMMTVQTHLECIKKGLKQPSSKIHDDDVGSPINCSNGSQSVIFYRCCHKYPLFTRKKTPLAWCDMLAVKYYSDTK